MICRSLLYSNNTELYITVRRAARKDDNHKEIESAFQSLGWSVLDLSQLKKACDIAIGKSGYTAMIEIKDGSKPPSQRKLTDGEIEFRDRWLGDWFLVESIDDVLKIDNQITGQI